MKSAAIQLETIEQRTERLVDQLSAKGDLERNFCREIASSQVTFESYERTVLLLQEADTPNARDVHRFQLAKSHAQRDEHRALKELKALQTIRNQRERFPDQTVGCPPIADHTPFIGDEPKIKPIPPILRGTLPSPTDNTPRKPVRNPLDQQLDEILNRDIPLDKSPKKPNKDFNPTLKHP